jgi:HK97 family phage major capsid protein
MTAFNLQELKTAIRESVREELANKAINAIETAQEDARKAQLQGRDLMTELLREVRGQEKSQQSVIMNKDPRGLSFTRMLKAATVAKGEGGSKSARDIAHSWGKQHRHYKEVADLLDAQQKSGAERTLSEGAFASGGSLVPPPAQGEFIEMTYARTLALEMGANRLEINRTLDLGKQTGSATAYYVDEMANITPSTPSTAKLSLTNRKAAAVVILSNELLRNPSVGADIMVRNDLVRVMANRRDLSFFRGTGVQGQPKGMLNWRDSGNTDTQGGTTVADKVSDTVQLIRMVDEGDIGLESCGFVMAPRTRWGLASTYDSTTGLVFASMLLNNTLWGFPVGSTTAIPKNLGGGGTESEIHFGNFGETIISFDDTIPTEVELFPNGTYHDGSSLVSGISNDSSVIRIKEAHDVVLKRAKAWATLTAVTWA